MNSLNDFWELTLDVWDKGVYGMDIGKVGVAILIVAVFLILRRLFTYFILSAVKGIARGTGNTMDDAAIAALENPIRFIPLVLGLFIATEYVAFSGTFQIIADNLIRSMIAFTIFWGFYNLVDPMSVLLGRLEKVFSTTMVAWLVKTIKGAFIFIGAATILEIWGIAVAPILAGLGLFGVAVALAAQDMFKNLIAGILIIAEKRFHPGDWIRVEGTVEGTVEAIGFRSTLVRRFDKAPVYVPNTKLSDSAVINFTAMTHRRIYWKLGVEYNTTVDQLRKIRDGIEGYLTGSPDFAQPPETAMFVRIDSFSDSSIDLMVYCFTKTTDWGEWLEIKERLAYEIKDIVETAGSAFAFPSQSVYVETLPTEQPEPFVPPATNKEPETS